MLAGTLLLAGCTGDDEEPTAPGQEAVEGGEEAGAPPPTSPLTGLELGRRAATRPVIGVKVDNTSSSSPQLGLGSADMLVEELVEGGMTRIAAFFHTAVPSNVGPVRSLRATDIGVVRPLGAVLVASFSGSSTTSFEFQRGVYVNADSYAAEGDRFAPATVLVLRVPVGDAGYLDPSGNTVPETKFTGQGPAMIFHGGRVVRGTWAKAGLDASVRLKAGGSALRLPAGKVWIELVPADAGGVTFGR